jgi:hypothetical protein
LLGARHRSIFPERAEATTFPTSWADAQIEAEEFALGTTKTGQTCPSFLN